MLPALHVAAMSVLENFSKAVKPAFYVASDDLLESDVDLLRETLLTSDRDFDLKLLRVRRQQFEGCLKLNSSLATYYRILLPELLDCDKYLYLDVDIFCGLDVAPLREVNLEGKLIALVPESPLEKSIDHCLKSFMPLIKEGYYYNAGVSLVNAAQWRKEEFSRQVLEFSKQNSLPYHDQSALNILCSGRIRRLEDRYNTMTNMRKHWPKLLAKRSRIDCLAHFADYPKPWDSLGKWVHPFGELWWSEYRRTAHFKKTPLKLRSFRLDKRTMAGYRKVGKDRVLFLLYKKGLLLPKGVPRS